MSYILIELKNSINKCIINAIKRSIENNELEIDKIPDIIIEVPKDKQHGDFASNIAMQLPKIAKKPPRLIAEIIIKNSNIDGTYIKGLEIAGPGFINFKLKNDWLYNVIEEILINDKNYGKLQDGNGKKINVEYISANPTGPMHMGNARGGAIGDGVSSILEWAGYTVTREFYINDAGNQIEKFGHSLDARYRELLGEEIEFPEDGYKGDDIIEHMKEFIKLKGDKYLEYSSKDRMDVFIEYALKINIDRIKRDLQKYGIKYDVWFSEKSMHENEDVLKAIKLIEKNGYSYEKDGAIWFKATEFGCEKDDVLIRNNGVPTYFAADIAYHINKLNIRGFDKSINVWGADHHGHVARLKAALQAVGISSDKLEIIIMQLVRLTRNGEIAKMSKRSGKMITLSDLVEEVGKDVTRFFFNMRSPDSHLDFDLDLAVKESNENPVFYVQYAHARICSILRQMEEIELTNVDKKLLKENEEIDLIKKLAELPIEIRNAVEKMDPSKITKYAIELSSEFHSFYNACRVRIEDQELMKARVQLIKCTKQVLKNVLEILGIEAPERM